MILYASSQCSGLAGVPKFLAAPEGGHGGKQWMLGGLGEAACPWTEGGKHAPGMGSQHALAWQPP